ncbi:sigma-E factor negative regulatory protein RseA [Allochromatium warmingii]|uniref:Sigma-E factor negative regulatory protein RseA n=1 Tax=Allochromatium warmingii TaxID=61595 RepID=A0A1H3B544_ALLWA|nr:sigma-E factor negative regulatory protein [Allochromatium warmingii]SDX36808.1 sigma-E factor negative regulatory protein RseA [Allochromatium warmingii]
MIDEPKHRLSALLDGELAATQLPALLDALTDDPELRACWERYTLIGQSIRGEAIHANARQLAEQVRTALHAEPTLLRPPRSLSTPRRWRRRDTGWALAASVTLMAVLTLPLLSTDSDAPELADVSRNTPLSVPLVEQQLAQQFEHQRWHLEQPELASKLDRYLVTHQAKASASGATGLLPYAMLVGYETGR